MSGRPGPAAPSVLTGGARGAGGGVERDTVGGAKIVSGVLVVQPTEGQFAAFAARCPHRGAPVSLPKAGVVTCYEHNSTFTDTDGSLLDRPARRGLRPVPITVTGTTITRTA